MKNIPLKYLEECPYPLFYPQDPYLPLHLSFAQENLVFVGIFWVTWNHNINNEIDRLDGLIGHVIIMMITMPTIDTRLQDKLLEVDRNLTKPSEEKQSNGMTLVRGPEIPIQSGATSINFQVNSPKLS